MNIQNIPDQKVDYSILPQGHLVKMTCGHRGIPCRTEEKRVSRLLRKSGFIPMLDNEPKNKKPGAAKTTSKICDFGRSDNVNKSAY